MKNMRKFFRTRIEVEILSEEEPVKDASLSEIAHEIIYGSWSGRHRTIEEKSLSPKECAKALIEHGSDPSFFGLSESGEGGESY